MFKLWAVYRSYSYLNRYFGKIQDKDEEYYKQFQIIICGLDSIEARRWINATLVGMAEDDAPIPLIDGGTEGIFRLSTLISSNTDLRLPRTITSDPSKHYFVLRMLSRHAHTTDCIPHLHHCQHPSSSRTLHRMGFRPRMAQSSRRQEIRQ